MVDDVALEGVARAVRDVVEHERHHVLLGDASLLSDEPVRMADVRLMAVVAIGVAACDQHHPGLPARFVVREQGRGAAEQTDSHDGQPHHPRAPSAPDADLLPRDKRLLAPGAQGGCADRASSFDLPVDPGKCCRKDELTAQDW